MAAPQTDPSTGKYVQLEAQPAAVILATATMDPITVSLSYKDRRWQTPFALVDLVHPDGQLEQDGLQGHRHSVDAHSRSDDGCTATHRLFSFRSLSISRRGTYCLRFTVFELSNRGALVIGSVITDEICVT